MSGIKTFISRGSASLQLRTLARVVTLLVALAVLTTAGVLCQAQSNFTVIHNFTGAADGSQPVSTPTLDRAGNLYGTTHAGGTNGCINSGPGCGTVYRLTHGNGSWTFHPLYSFTGGSDGGNPVAGVTIGPDGTLFGVTGMVDVNLGTLFRLQPPRNACRTALCPWTDTILHYFGGGSDGANPTGNVVFDSQGNLYGTTTAGGTYQHGMVYKATRSGSTWNLNPLYSFGASGNDGSDPLSGLVLDGAGNIYGTTYAGGLYGYGTVFELSPSQEGWIETILYSFTGESDGIYPAAGLVFDPAGNLYGATSEGRPGEAATIFELSPQGGGWNFATIYTLPGFGPQSTLAIDSAGNLYGTVPYGGSSDWGNVFELSPAGGGWIYIDLYDFTGGNDGSNPLGGVVVTSSGGYLYGTTAGGGTNGDGVIYQINLGARR